MLAMKPACESCGATLSTESPLARICAEEHTYCAECMAQRLGGACPKCAGLLVPRPRRITAAAQVGEPCLRSEPFAPRELRFHGVVAWKRIARAGKARAGEELAHPAGPKRVRCARVPQNGWRVKVYTIRFPARTAPGTDAEVWTQAEAIAAPVLFAAAPAGAAFVTLHAGASGDYLLVDWWSDQDILNHRLFYRPLHHPAFADAQHKSWMACVWELRVIEAERRFWQQSTMNLAPDRYFSLALADGLLD